MNENENDCKNEDKKQDAYHIPPSGFCIGLRFKLIS